MSLVLLRDGDDVAVATATLPAGARIPVRGTDLVLSTDVPCGHKVAVRDLDAGALVHKYGQVIGQTLAAVRAGQHVHVHNLGMPQQARTRAAGGPPVDRPRSAPGDLPSTFRGYRRPDGRVATRNYVGVLSTVNCSATVARRVARLTEDEISGVEGVDGVVALTHGSGCGMAADGPGRELLQRTLAGYARNPNIAALVVVGLGCEVNTVAEFMSELGVADQLPVAAYTIQDTGGTAAAVRRGVRLVRRMAGELAGAARTEAGVGELVLGLQCGGSDGWSGLTANPALGVASDLLVAAGATCILGETPEIYGAEHLLTARAAGDVAGDLMERIRWWEQYTRSQGTTLDANPSPGNKAGGITTILEKSLGAVAKAGHSRLTAVRRYAEQVPRTGLVFMDTPGYDPVSVTGMVAGGATLVCFTTGRGSVFGSRPVPTVKLASNAELARRMAADIDLDCSPIVEQSLPVEQVGRQVYQLLLAVASGRRTASEELGLGGEEIVPWQLGAVL